MSKTPFFTIITATYNAAETLPRLLQSLAEQTCQDFQWIMQDGASGDASVEVARAWQGRFPIHITSAKDSGIYNAWNTALMQNASQLGQWVLFLGADDTLAGPHVLEKVKKACEGFSHDVLFALGDMQIITDGEQRVCRKAHAHHAFNTLFCRMVAHPALFTRKEVFATQLFDESYKIAADYQWFQCVWKAQEQLTELPLVITHMWEGGVSTSNLPSVHAETLRILLKNPAKRIKDYPLYILMLFFYASSPIRHGLMRSMQKFAWSRMVLAQSLRTLRKIARCILRIAQSSSRNNG